MAQKSKYSNEQLEALLQDLFVTLEKHQANAELSLMALGNMITNILVNNTKDQAQRERLAAAFADTLKQSMKATR